MQTAHFKAHSSVQGFLTAYVASQKAVNSKYRLNDFAKALSNTDPSTLTKILNGSRAPGPELTDRLIEYFQFDANDAAAFRTLVNASKPGKLVNADSSYIFNETLRLEHEKYQVLSSWHYLTLRELTLIDDFNESPEWIQKHLSFKITPTQIEKGFETLLRLGLLERNKKGKLQPAHGYVTTSNDVASTAVKTAHLQHLENTKTALLNCDVLDREFQATVFVLDESKMALAKEMIRKFQTDLLKAVEATGKTTPKSRLFQAQFHLFPVTEKPQPKNPRKKLSL